MLQSEIMINTTDRDSVTAWLAECQYPLILSHIRPDGDSLGAQAAMYFVLEKLGRRPEVVLYEPIPSQYEFMREMLPWRHWDDVRDVMSQNCDAAVVVDTCAQTQLEPAMDFLRRAPRTLVIDHHATRDAIGTRAGDLHWFDETAGATCLMLAEWIPTLRISLEPPLSTALFTGMATDCGWFRFSNTDARMMRVAADLAESGTVPSEIYNAIYQQEPPAKLRLIAHMLTNMELLADGKLAVLYLRDVDFQKTGGDRTMTSDLVNEANRLAGVEATLLFTEETDGAVRVNLRSKQYLDVSALARRFGGGGHTRAAGARPHGSWDAVVPRVIAETIAAM